MGLKAAYDRERQRGCAVQRLGRGASSVPVGPDAIHHAVVSVKGWIARRGEEISSGVTADGVVNAAMRADFHRIRDSFGEKAILIDVRLVQQFCLWSAVVFHNHCDSTGIRYTVE